MKVKVRGVMPDHRRVQPLRFRYLPDRAAERRGSNTDLCGLLGIEISPRVCMPARADKKMAELRFWLEQRRDVERDHQLGFPQEAARKIDLSGYFATHITAAHGDHTTWHLLGSTLPNRANIAAICRSRNPLLLTRGIRWGNNPGLASRGHSNSRAGLMAVQVALLT